MTSFAYSSERVKAHSEKGPCTKTLRYSPRAGIVPDEEFKNVSFIRKDSENFVDALTRFHFRQIKRKHSQSKKLEQLE